MCFNKEKMKDVLSYLLSNCLFVLGLKNFCQIIGIPIGSDSAQFSDNLFLYYYENKWVNSLKQKWPIKSQETLISRLNRFNDELNVIDNEKEFEDNF